MLISAAYDGVEKIAVLKFYVPETQKLILWKDETGHKPYCYSRLNKTDLSFLNERDDILSIETITRNDMLQDKSTDVSKIIAADPLVIGGTMNSKSIRNSMDTWESDIKYYENYLYDSKLIIGKYYSIKDGKISPHEMQIPQEILYIPQDTSSR